MSCPVSADFCSRPWCGCTSRTIPFLSGAGETVGASASICGLIGAISCYGRRSGSGLIRAQTSQWGLSLVVMGSLFPGIDNVAHLGGFLGRLCDL